jgi:uncharacterized phage-associated protein
MKDVKLTEDEIRIIISALIFKASKLMYPNTYKDVMKLLNLAQQLLLCYELKGDDV